MGSYKPVGKNYMDSLTQRVEQAQSIWLAAADHALGHVARSDDLLPSGGDSSEEGSTIPASDDDARADRRRIKRGTRKAI